MTVCPVGECTNPLPPHPSLWVTSTNPAIECCGEKCLTQAYKDAGMSAEPAPRFAEETITRRRKWAADDAAAARRARADDDREAD